MLKYASMAALSAMAAGQEEADKCRALVMSGGANYGAWEVGIIWGLLHYGNPADYTWDVMTGVSVGSINTCAGACFAKGDELNMSVFLSDAWQNLTTPDIWVYWQDSNVADWIFEKPGILDTSPAVPFLASLVKDLGSIKRRFTMATVDVGTGEYIGWDQKSVSFEELPHAAFASGSMPAIFPYQIFQGHVLMDGGTVQNINIDSAVN